MTVDQYHAMNKVTRPQAARIAALYNNLEVCASKSRDPESTESVTDLFSRARRSAQALHDEFGIRIPGWEQHLWLDPVETAPATIAYVDSSGQRIMREYPNLEEAHVAAAQIGSGATIVDGIG